MKYLNVTVPQQSVSTTATITNMINIGQGTTDSQRVGDKLRLSKAYLRLFVDGADSYNYVRIIFFQWKPMNSTPPTAGDILLLGSSSSIDYTSQYNHDKRTLYRIIYDRTVKTVGDGASASTPAQDSFRHFYKTILRFPNKNMMFDATSGTVATNCIYSLLISDSVIGAHPGVFWTLKIMYTDQ